VTRATAATAEGAAGAGLRAAGAAIRTFNTVKEIADKQKEKPNASTSGDPLSNLTPDQLKTTQENLPIFLEALWHVSVVDIERTLNAVTCKVCRDHSVDEATRMMRAEGLLLISQIFMEEAVAKGGSKDASKKVTEMVQLIAPLFNTKGAGGEAAAHGSTAGSGAGATTGGAGGSSSMDAQSEAIKQYSIEELRVLPVRELKRLLHAYGVSEVEVVEKEELVQVIYALQQSRVCEGDD